MPVTLILNSVQTMDLIKNTGELKVTLTDDQAIEVIAQAGKLLQSKPSVHLEEGSEPKVRRKYRKFRRFDIREGMATISGKVYAHVLKFPPGTEFHYAALMKDLTIAESSQSSAWSAIKRMCVFRKIKRLGKGHYRVL